MIVANIEDFRKYERVNKHFTKVCDFLESTDLTSLEDGRIEIDGDNVFANCMTYVADGVAGNLFEFHKKYFDIHMVLDNVEDMAVTTEDQANLVEAFDEKKDIGFYKSDKYHIIKLVPGNLLVTFEEDIHQPKIRVNDDKVKKLVIKVALN